MPNKNDHGLVYDACSLVTACIMNFGQYSIKVFLKKTFKKH